MYKIDHKKILEQYICLPTKVDFLLPDLDLEVISTTVIRKTSNSLITGFLYVINWKENKVLKKIPVPIKGSSKFWNDRGGNRGGRGILKYQDKLYIATESSLRVYDSGYNFIGEINNEKFAGLHEICADKDGFWITSTVHDLVLKIDHNGKIIDEWFGSESKKLLERFSIKPRFLNIGLNFEKDNFKNKYDEYCMQERLHVNSVNIAGHSVYVYCPKIMSLIKIRPLPEEVVMHDKTLIKGHNGIMTDDNKIIVNDTINQAVRIYDATSGCLIKIISTMIYDEHLSEQFARAGWQRGLMKVTDQIYLVGTSPATVFELDIENNFIGKIFKLDSKLSHCVHGLYAFMKS